MRIQMRGTCYLTKYDGRLYARDVAGDSGESNAQSGGDNTTGISASTVAANFVVLFQQFILNCTLNYAKISDIYMTWSGDYIPTAAI
jgi:hypothetical protein